MNYKINTSSSSATMSDIVKITEQEKELTDAFDKKAGERKDALQSDIEKINSVFPKYMHIDDYEIMEEEFEKNSTKKIIRSKYVN